MLNRRAATLVELLVSLTIAAIVFGAATASVLRQQRTHARIAGVSATEVQLRTATALLASQLAYLDAAAGDLALGEARDTAIQLRATVAIAITCATATGRVTFLPDMPGVVALGGVASQPREGDSLWFLGDSSWQGARITDVALATVACPAPFSVTGSALHLSISAPDTIPAGTPIRVTRPIRYAFYRSGDGTWQLGLREWSEAAGAFSSPQPVAGPFLRNSDGRQSRFRYFGGAGEELADVGFERSVARIRLVAHARIVTREAAQDSVRSDSVDVALQHAIAR
jgi:hypothetical protein